MDRIDLAIITFSVGLVCATVIAVFSNLYHKWKKIDSFKIIDTETQIILKNNSFTNVLSSLSYFFVLTLFTIFVAANQFNLYVELGIIYLVCLLLAIWNFVKKKNNIITIEKASKQVVIKGRSYSLENNNIVTSLNRSWLSDDITSYGLYLKDKNDKHVLVYGYSVYKDIENLRSKLLEKVDDI